MAVIPLAGCDMEESTTGAVVLESYGPNPVLRGSDLTFIGQNFDKVTAVILPVNIEIPASQFKDATATSFKVTVPMECEPGEVSLVFDMGTVTAKTTLSYTEQFSISSVKPQDETKTVLVAGDSVVVEGEYLNNIVKFVFDKGGAVAEGEMIGVHTRRQVTFAVPMGAMTGRIYGEDANGNQVYSENELNILQPTVSGVTPLGVRPGDRVTISGSLLDQVLSVAFTGSEEAIPAEQFGSMSATSFTVTVPSDAKDGALTLISAAQQEIVTEQKIVMRVPAGLELAAENVYKPGREIVITGTDLDLVTGVKFAGGESGVDGTFSYADGALKVTVPDAAADGALTLSTAAGKSVQTASVTMAKPVITAVSSTVVAGETFAVSGTDLDLVTEVTLGGTGCTFSVTDDGKSITVTTSATSATGKVAVSTANGYSTEWPTEVEVSYNSVVIVSSLTESVAPGGTVTMQGSKFNMIEAIYVGTTKVTSYTTRTDTEYIFTIPAVVASGSYNLRFVLTTGEEETCALSIEVTGSSGDSGVDPVLSTDIMIIDYEEHGDHGDHNGSWDNSWGSDGKEGSIVTKIETVDGNTYLKIENDETNAPESTWLVNCNHFTNGALTPKVNGDIQDYVVKVDVFVPAGWTYVDGDTPLSIVFNNTWASIGDDLFHGVVGEGKWITLSVPVSSTFNGFTDLTKDTNGIAINKEAKKGFPTGMCFDNFRLSLK